LIRRTALGDSLTDLVRSTARAAIGQEAIAVNGLLARFGVDAALPAAATTASAVVQQDPACARLFASAFRSIGAAPLEAAPDGAARAQSGERAEPPMGLDISYYRKLTPVEKTLVHG